MQRSAQLITAQWLITAHESGVQTIESGAVHVDGAGQIVAVGTATELRAALDRSGAAHTVVDLGASILMPGLINAHTHAAMSLLRGAADDMALSDWLQKRIWPMEAALVDESFVLVGTQLAAAEMLLGGTTTCADMYFYPKSAANAFLSMGMRAQLALPILDFPTRYAADPDAYLALGLEARDEFKGEALLSFALGPHAPYTVGDATFARINAYAAELGMVVHTHLQETAQEVVDAVAKDGVRPTERLQKLGTLSPDFLGAHGVHLNDADIALLAQNNASIVHCPSSNLKLASGIAPVSAMLKAGINVALGTDGAASNNRLDLFEEMRLMALLAKVKANNATAVTAAQAFAAATLGGARALGLSDTTGSIAPGKAADLVAVATSRVGMTPLYDPVSHLVYAATRDDVTDVWVGGDRRVTNRVLAANADRALNDSMPAVNAFAERVRALQHVDA
ncbi:MAG: TRZ/ATZ family hydrolase [Betaproteobacteria bacterium]|nr:MAG: TRZ/ATZ family hydrolase [Betaproteobacteria bacterium]